MPNSLRSFEGVVTEKAFDVAFQFGRLSLEFVDADPAVQAQMGHDTFLRLGNACMDLSANLLGQISWPKRTALDRKLSIQRSYANWAAQSFETFRDRPLAHADFGVIFFLEEYVTGARNPSLLLAKAATNFPHLTLKIQKVLAQKGMQFKKLHTPERRVIFICTDLDREIKLEDIDLTLGPTEAELIRAGKDLRADLPLSEMSADPVRRQSKPRQSAEVTKKDAIAEGTLSSDDRKSIAEKLLSQDINNSRFRAIILCFANDIPAAEIAERIGESEAALDELLLNLSNRYLKKHK